MDRRFAADEWEKMSQVERVARCHVLAEEARKLADKASPTMRKTYLDLAGQWLTLAQEMLQAQS